MHQNEYETKALEVLRSGWYILGREVEAFEQEFAAYLGIQHCVGVANGLDALEIAFRTLNIGPGDEVIVAANSYIACVMGITKNGATPVFVEPNRYYNIDPDAVVAAITPKTKAVLAVHLYGQSCDLSLLKTVCDANGIYLVEDCAQSHGAKSHGQISGTVGHIGCFSFYPSKNLGAFGDGGAIVTNDDSLAKHMRILRNYGSEKRYYNQEVGYNSRLDEIQAGFLRVKLKHLDALNEERINIASRYLTAIDNPKVKCPQTAPDCTHIYHLFVLEVEERERFMAYMQEHGIGTVIHYPIPPHLSEAYKSLGFSEGAYPLTEHFAKTVVSIPIYNGMTAEETDYVIHTINQFK